MPGRRPASTMRLLARRSRARLGLLASAAATMAVAVATVCVVLGGLVRAAADAGQSPPPGWAPDEVAASLAVGSEALAAAAPALVLLVALLAGTAVAQLARLLAAAREHETTTVRARGLSGRQAWAMDAAEAALAAIVGAILGLALAVGVSAIGRVPLGDVLSAWPWALATAAVLAIVYAVALRRGGRIRSASRAARATAAGLVVIVLLASALVLWQLPLARAGGFDPVVAVAPAVLLLAGSLVALAVFGIAAVAWARPAATAPGLQPAYPARQVSRRIPIYAVAVLLVALTVAQAVFASAYSATWLAMTSASAAVRSGADLRVDTAPATASAEDVAAAAAVAGVDAAAPALVTTVEVGETDAQLVSVPASAVDTVVAPAGGLVDVDALAAAGADPDTASADPVPLGDAATSVRVTATLENAGGILPTVNLAVVLVDVAGAPAVVSLDDGFTTNDDGTVTRIGEAPLPDGTAPWRLLAVTAGLAPTAANRSATVTIEAVEALATGPLDVDGTAELGNGVADAVLWLAGADADGGGDAEAEAGADADADDPPVAAAVSADLATRLGVSEGDAVEFRYQGSGRTGAAVISAVVDAVPGAADPLSFFVPLESLLASQLQRGTSIVSPNAVWAAGSPDADVALSAALGDRPVLTAEPGLSAQVVGALVPGWWTATAGAALLSLVAALAIVQTLSIARRREVGVLRALGVSARQQARMFAAELAAVFASALVLGVGAGLLVSWLLVPALVGAVTPGILAVAGGVSIDAPALAVALAVLTAGLAVVAMVGALAVVRTARSATVGEEAR